MNNYTQRLQRLKTSFLSGKLKLQVEKPVTEHLIEEIEEQLGYSLPDSFLNFFRETNGLSLKWADEHFAGSINILPLQNIFGGLGKVNRVWSSDETFRNVLWFDHFKDEIPERDFSLLKKLKLLERLEGVSLDIAILPGPQRVKVYAVERGEVISMGLIVEEYLDWAVELGGFFDWQYLFLPDRQPSIGWSQFNRELNILFPDTKLWRAGFSKKKSKELKKLRFSKLERGARVVCTTSGYRGILLSRNKKELELLLDIGVRVRSTEKFVSLASADAYEKAKEDSRYLSHYSGKKLIQEIFKIAGEPEAFGPLELYSLQNNAVHLYGISQKNNIEDSIKILTQWAKILIQDWPREESKNFHRGDAASPSLALELILGTITLFILEERNALQKRISQEVYQELSQVLVSISRVIGYRESFASYEFVKKYIVEDNKINKKVRQNMLHVFNAGDGYENVD